MKRQKSSLARGEFLLKYSVEFFAVLYLLMLCQMTLVPLDFAGKDLSLVASNFLNESVDDFTTQNVVSNITMFIPMGVLLFWVLHRKNCNFLFGLAVTTLLCGIVSISLEYVQAFSATRVSSGIDLLCNMTGAAFGAILGWLCRWLVPSVVGRLSRTVRENPRLAIVQIYVILLLFLAAAPFTYSVDRTWLKRAMERATFIPFEEDVAAQELSRDAYEQKDYAAYAMHAYERQWTWAFWAVELVSFAVLGFLLHQLLREDFKFGPFGTAALVLWIGLPLAVVLSIFQWPNVMRGFHVTSIILRLAGLTVGLVYRQIISIRLAGSSEDANGAHRKRLATVGIYCIFAFILYTGLIPWMLAKPEGASSLARPSIELLPFSGYFVSRFPVMLQDLIVKGFAFGLLGALMTVAWDRIRDKPLKAKMAAAGVVGLVLALPIEIAQLLLPIRVTSLTDLMVAAVGCSLGVLIVEQLGAAYRVQSGHRMSLHPSRRRRSRSATDELIGTLVDESPDAPKEQEVKPPQPAK